MCDCFFFRDPWDEYFGMALEIQIMFGINYKDAAEETLKPNEPIWTSFILRRIKLEVLFFTFNFRYISLYSYTLSLRMC